MSALTFVKPKPPPLRSPWDKVVVYLPMGKWKWSMPSQKYGKQEVYLATIPQLNMMVFWNSICRMDVVYLKQNGVMKFRILKNSKELYEKLDQLIVDRKVPDYGLKNVDQCQETNGRILAVEYLLKNTKHIIVKPNQHLAFKDDDGFIAVYKFHK